MTRRQRRGARRDPPAAGASLRLQVWVKGRLGNELKAATGCTRGLRRPGGTVLEFEPCDDAEVYQILDRLHDFGLDVLTVKVGSV